MYKFPCVYRKVNRKRTFFFLPFCCTPESKRSRIVQRLYTLRFHISLRIQFGKDNFNYLFPSRCICNVNQINKNSLVFKVIFANTISFTSGKCRKWNEHTQPRSKWSGVVSSDLIWSSDVVSSDALMPHTSTSHLILHCLFLAQDLTQNTFPNTIWSASLPSICFNQYKRQDLIKLPRTGKSPHSTCLFTLQNWRGIKLLLPLPATSHRSMTWGLLLRLSSTLLISSRPSHSAWCTLCRMNHCS